MARLRCCEIPSAETPNLQHENERLRWWTVALCAPVLTAALGLWFARIDVTQREPQAGAVTFLDRNGLPLGTVLGTGMRRATFVPLDHVAPVFTQAVVCVEDHRFYHHPGIDVAAVARALRQAVQQGTPGSGASTIPMQLARMREGIPGTMRGKLHEMWSALRIEAGSSKSAILEAYVNALPMGGNAYGVEAAARTYFGEPAADLDAAQAALLAAIPNDPARLNPRAHVHALMIRQRFVLGRMRACGIIGERDAQTAAHETLHFITPVRGVLAAAHALFELAPQVPPGASRVQTTLDRPLQMFAETQLRALLAVLGPRNVHQGAALVLDNATGAVLAYVGSADYFDDANHGRNDGVRALRQPGSALKPFLYELALERGVIAPNTILADVPVTYAIANGRLYQPSDYSNAYAGPVRVRAALANSLNVPAVHVLAETGAPVFLDRLHDLGFSHLNRPAAYYGLGLTLGGGEVSLWELTHAYLTMARAGDAIPLSLIAQDAPPQGVPAGKRQLWLLVTDMLADTHARARSFGTHSILDLPFAAAVKTGTSSDFRDTWTVGFSSRYTVGVWVGNFDGKPMRRVSGVTGAAPLWNRIMLRLHERAEPAPFAQPPGMVRRPVCSVTGWRPLPDCPAVVSEYLFPRQLARYARRVPVRLARTYDEWLAMQDGVDAAPGGHIVFPHDGDVFALNATDDSVSVSAPQALVFRMNVPRGGNVRWQLNGRTLAQHGSRISWQLEPGTWRLRALFDRRADTIEFKVVRAGRRTRKGFAL